MNPMESIVPTAVKTRFSSTAQNNLHFSLKKIEAEKSYACMYVRYLTEHMYYLYVVGKV